MLCAAVLFATVLGLDASVPPLSSREPVVEVTLNPPISQAVPAVPAQFGQPHYDSTVSGRLVYCTPHNRKACSPINPTLAVNWPLEEAFILLVDRGDCAVEVSTPFASPNHTHVPALALHAPGPAFLVLTPYPATTHRPGRSKHGTRRPSALSPCSWQTTSSVSCPRWAPLATAGTFIYPSQ